MKLQNFELNRSYLFVPGNRPERFQKAIDSGADVVIIDLEDAVPLSEKDSARTLVSDYFETKSVVSVPVYLRLNSIKTSHGLRDVLSLLNFKEFPKGLVIPMVDSPEEIQWYENILSKVSKGLNFFIVIETAIGLDNVEAIVFSSDKISAVGFGSADYTSQTKSNLDWDSLLFARSRIINAAAMAEVQAVDGVWPDIKDAQGLIHETEKVSKLGFSGKIAIHPVQISGIHQGFLPSQDDIDFAHEVVSAYEKSSGGAITVKGKMIDEPLVVAARRIIAMVKKN